LRRWSSGKTGRLRQLGRVDMTRSSLEGFGKRLQTSDEVVVEATGNAMAVVRVLSPFVARVIIANPLQVKAIAYAHVKTDKIDAGVLANLYAAGFLPEVWTPDAETEQLRRLVTRRNQLVKSRTRIKNEVHAILHAHLIPAARMPICSTVAVESGSRASRCRPTRRRRSSIMCASSIAWERT
jgi:transposase